ncbi:glycosyltransferase family 39 protein, partial [Escherichia coli]|nr:glycosyltransferase family 39 protein [Escherichia coli]
YVICRESENASGSSEKISFAELAALMAATSLGIIVFSRGASFDIILTFPLTASLACFYRYYRNNSAGWLTGFYIFAGVSTLAKGLVG